MAAACGIVGLRPTFGLVSRQGIMPASWSLDTAGPMTKTVADCAVLLQAIAGDDPHDRTSSRHPVPDYSRTADNRACLPARPPDYARIGRTGCEAIWLILSFCRAMIAGLPTRPRLS